MALSEVERARALMACMRDQSRPLTESQPISDLIALVPPGQADKWGQKFYETGPKLRDNEGQERQWTDLTVAERGDYYLDSITLYHRQKNRAKQVPQATNDARQDAQDSADDETVEDIKGRDPAAQGQGRRRNG